MFKTDIYHFITKNSNLDKSRILAIRDSLYHDIKGAYKFKIDSILVKSGFHNKSNIDKIIKINQIKPTYIINKFAT